MSNFSLGVKQGTVLGPFFVCFSVCVLFVLGLCFTGQPVGAQQQNFPNAAASDWMTLTRAGGAGIQPATSSNKALMWGIVLPVPLVTTQVTYSIGANADNSTTNTYDLCLFSTAGSLAADLGAIHGSVFAPGTGVQTNSWAQGRTALASGRYFLTYTTSCTSGSCPTLSDDSTPLGITWYKNETGFAIATGGTCPSSITPPSASYSLASGVPWVELH